MTRPSPWRPSGAAEPWQSTSFQPLWTVRTLSASQFDTALVGRQQPSGCGGGAPFSQDELLAEVRHLGALLDGVADLSRSGMPWTLPWTLVPVRRNVQLALRRPETLASVENQLDFVEELAEAAWQQPLPDLGAGCGGRASWDETSAQQRLAESFWERLDAAAERLCERVERWHRRRESVARGLAATPSQSPG